MVQIDISSKRDNKNIVSLHICDRLTLMVGDSGSGKSLTCDALTRASRQGSIYKYTAYRGSKQLRVVTCTSVVEMQYYYNDKSFEGNVIIADEYVANEAVANGVILETITKSNVYTILMFREFKKKINIGLSAVHELYKDADGIIKNRAYIKLNEVEHNK